MQMQELTSLVHRPNVSMFNQCDRTCFVEGAKKNGRWFLSCTVSREI